MNIYFEYIFRRGNLQNVISFPFSIHLIENDNLEILSCQKKNSKFYFKTWNLQNFSGPLPSFQEIETNNFIDYCFDNVDVNKIVNINKIFNNRANLLNNTIMSDELFNYFYNNIIKNNVENLQDYKRSQLFKFLFKTEFYNFYNCSKVLNSLELNKWKICEKFLLKNMFPGELIFHH